MESFSCSIEKKRPLKSTIQYDDLSLELEQHQKDLFLITPKKRKHQREDEQQTKGLNQDGNNAEDRDEEFKRQMKREWEQKTSQKKLRMTQPKMFLINSFINDKNQDTRIPVKIKDIQDFIQYSVMGNAANINKIRFCKLVRPMLVSKVIVIILDGLTDEHYQENKDCFFHLKNNFELTGQILQFQSKSILNQLLQIEISRKQLKKKAYKTRGKAIAHTKTKLSYTQYLLNDEKKPSGGTPEQMILNMFIRYTATLLVTRVSL
jgi:hypothetical protein